MISLRLRDRIHMWFLQRVMDATWRHFPDFYQRVGARLYALSQSVGAGCVARGGHRAKEVPDRWAGSGRKRFCLDCGHVLKVTDPIVSIEGFWDLPVSADNEVKSEK